MSGVLDGITVLDLSWGISGPVSTMLLADHGAQVTKIEPPGGDPFRSLSGYRVWSRGKRSAVLDLKDAEDLEVFRNLVARADVLVESFEPGVTADLGIDYERLRELNPRLIHCSITGYGETGRHAGRPGYEALVAARTGQQWEHRGVVGGTIERISGGEGIMPGLEPPTRDCWVGPDREGPLFGGVPWTSLATSHLATLAISAALRAREHTGRGQHVSTSLLQGIMVNTIGPWQRAEHYDRPGFQSWIIDPRAPKGFWQASDGRWLHHWVPLPSFVLGVSQGDELEIPSDDDDEGWSVTGPKDASMRVGVAPEDMIILHSFDEPMREAVGKFPGDEWVRLAAEVGVPVQPVRAPEEALLDPDLVDDGCVIEVEDHELGPLRQVGQVYRLSACPVDPPTPAVSVGTHTDEVRAEGHTPVPAPDATPPSKGDGDAPLAGVRVLDLGLAVAGPYGTQLLSDLGADVIKVNTEHDGYWFGSHIAMCCNRGKRSISLNLKDADGLAVLHRLVKSADIVQHNMRYDAAERLGVDYASLKEIKPDLIYCHTRGFERSWRNSLPGNDQTGAALAGTTWLDGGVDDDGKPVWSTMSLGDTGNGFLSAIGMVQALYHRDRTGEGQFVDTSILYAHMLNTSMTWISPDGAQRSERPSLDAMHLGWDALYRLYETGDGWLCIAATTDESWESLCQVLDRPELIDDERYATAADRREHRKTLGAEFEGIFARRSAADWFKVLDEAGVPCEISTPDFVTDLFDDPEMIEKGWVASYEQGLVGRMDVAGLGIDFQETPGVVQGPAPIVGEHTRDLLGDAGFSPEEIDDLIERRVAFLAQGR